MHKILIANIENWDSISEVPFIFKKADCIVDVLCYKNSWSIANKYFDNWIDGKNDAEFVTNKVIEKALSNEYDWILIGDDNLIKLLNEKITDETIFHKLIPLTKIENREALSSKAGFSKLCERTNVLSPKFIVYQNQSIAEIVAAFKFPLLVKQDLSWSGVGIFKCNNENELTDTLNKIEVKNNLVIQEFIEGEDIGVEALYKNGALVAFISSTILKYMGNAFSVSTRRTYYRDEDLKILLQQLGEAFGIDGFVNIAYMLEKNTGKYYLIEVDFRMNSWFAYGRFIGCDFSEAVKKYLDKNFNAKANEPMMSFEQSQEVALFFKDLRRTIIKKTYKDFTDWIFNRKGYWKFIPRDNKLLKKIYLDLKPMIVKRILRKKYTDMK